MAASHKIRIKLRAYDHRLLDQSAQEIVAAAQRTGADVNGPIPLPTDMTKYTVLRGPHIDKKSREQFDPQAPDGYCESHGLHRGRADETGVAGWRGRGNQAIASNERMRAYALNRRAV
jgi:hypothetical protein